jgi:hypothetical protein
VIPTPATGRLREAERVRLAELSWPDVPQPFTAIFPSTPPLRVPSKKQ